MERRQPLLLASLVLTLVAVGCGSSESPKPAAGGTARVENVPPPEHAVREFLEAVRVGNDAKVAEMLTELARQETEKHELVVSPPGSDTAKFEVGQVELVSADVAHVASKWIDVGEDGHPHADEIIWMLRRDPAGWRIAGMATKIFEDELPLLLDFENPEDMVRKQRLAEEEMQRRAMAGAAPPAGGAAAGGQATGQVPSGQATGGQAQNPGLWNAATQQPGAQQTPSTGQRPAPANVLRQ